jgi:hypothetical protein
MIKVQGHDNCRPENLKENMNPYWYEIEREKQKCTINDGSSYSDYTVSMMGK